MINTFSLGMKRLLGLAPVLACVLAGLTGCAADHRPKYVMPKKPLSDVAVVVGQYNVLSSFEIQEVDGARVDVPPFSMNYPVKVMPGERRLTVAAKTGGGESRYTFVHNFTAGHRYVISGSGLSQGGLKVTDKTTNTSTVID